MDYKELRDIPITRILGFPNDRRRMIRCPFHSSGREKTPSCCLYPNENKWHCFSCSSHGQGAINFVIALGYSFQDAVNELKSYV